MDSAFSMIIANFRSEKLDEVEKVLEKMGVERINVSRVRGFGEYHNYFAENWLENEVRVEIFTKTEQVERIAQAIVAAARTGEAGDGVIGVVPLGALYLIHAGCMATRETFWPAACA